VHKAAAKDNRGKNPIPPGLSNLNNAHNTQAICNTVATFPVQCGRTRIVTPT